MKQEDRSFGTLMGLIALIAMAVLAQPCLAAPPETEQRTYSDEGKLLSITVLDLADSYIGKMDAQEVASTIIDALADPKIAHGAAVAACKEGRQGFKVSADPIWIAQLEAAVSCLREIAPAGEVQPTLERAIAIALKKLDPEPRLLVLQPRPDSPVLAYSPVVLDEKGQMATTLPVGRIGISLIAPKEDGRLEVYAVEPGGSAARAGVARGDFITSIDGRPSSSIPANRILVALAGPAGSSVTIQLITKTGESRSVSVLREERSFQRPAQFYVKDRLAVISLPQLITRQSAKQVKEYIKTLRPAEASAIVLDLRESGGELNAVVEIADLFLERGLIVTEIDRKQARKQHSAKPSVIASGWPLFTVIDWSTNLGGAALAAALSDNKRALSVGVNTGKQGSLSTLFELDKTRHLKVPSGWLIRPNGSKLDSAMAPDIASGSPSGATPDEAFSIALKKISDHLQKP